MLGQRGGEDIHAADDAMNELNSQQSPFKKLGVSHAEHFLLA